MGDSIYWNGIPFTPNPFDLRRVRLLTLTSSFFFPSINKPPMTIQCSRLSPTIEMGIVIFTIFISSPYSASYSSSIVCSPFSINNTSGIFVGPLPDTSLKRPNNLFNVEYVGCGNEVQHGNGFNALEN